MNLEIEEIRKLIIIALFSDDFLMNLLVLKGGNALDLIHSMALRSSIDIDFSMEKEFIKKDLPAIQQKIEKILKRTFKPKGYNVFDITFKEKPSIITPDMAAFWGGYSIEFKLIKTDLLKQYKNNVAAQRRNAVAFENQKKRFTVDISKFEYCSNKIKKDLDGSIIYVYSPEMILFEKLRAICQQMPEYANIVNNPSRSARARDFFDIYTIMQSFRINLTSKENIALIKAIFQTKRVPIDFLKKIQNYREYHRSDFLSVQSTAKPGFVPNGFDFYFDYVLDIIKKSEPFWEK